MSSAQNTDDAAPPSSQRPTLRPLSSPPPPPLRPTLRSPAPGSQPPSELPSGYDLAVRFAHAHTHDSPLVALRRELLDFDDDDDEDGLPPIRRLIADRQIHVVFQPVVDLSTHAIFGYEALARTTSPDFSGPVSMFRAAVEHSCVGELGRTIRELAVEGCTDRPLFFNVHPGELAERWIVQPNDPVFCHSEDVYLEITKGASHRHFDLSTSILSDLRGRGVLLVVDDVGAGYSSLKDIADLCPRVVKLDRELIVGLTTNTRIHRLVSSIVVLCKDLGATVVAEGIETRGELHAAQAAGAQLGQGYLLARPSFPPPRVVLGRGA